MNSHSKHSAQAAVSLYSMRGKSWSCYQKHIANSIDLENDDSTLSEHRADVQRLDIRDFELYGLSPSDPGPMVLCNQCNHIMAPEGIMRHVKRAHGSKIVPAPSSKIRMASLLASKGNLTAASTLSSSIHSSSNRNNSSSTTAASLSTAFSNRLNVSKMAPPSHLSNSNSDDAVIGSSKSNQVATSHMVATIPNNSAATTYSTSTNRNLSSISTNASLTSSSSNSNSPTSSSKASNSGSTSSSKRSRKVLPIKYREYDPEKHCGVTLGNMKPCTRSLTCKTHQISLRRNVDGRSKPFDQLLADHRNSSKDPQQKHSGKQANYAFGENSNQVIGLDSIGDSNSSSSFDMERRSFSSNSNQSTLGNYVSDHSTVFPSSSQQNGNHVLPSALSSLSSGNGATSSFSYPDANSQQSKKNGSNAIPFTPSPDDRDNNLPQISDANNSNSTSVMQSSANMQANLSSASLNTSLPNLGDYSVQMTQLNDLINDDNGDCLDMSFWENFDNFSYESDLIVSNNNGQQQQQQTQSISKSSSKRLNSSHDGSSSERKRKRGNEPRDISNYNKKEPTKDDSSTKISGEISLSSQLSSDIGNNNSLLDVSGVSNATHKKSVYDNSGTNDYSYSNLLSQSYNNSAQASAKSFTNSSMTDVICIDDDDDDDNNNVDATVNRNADKDNGILHTSITPTKDLTHSSDEMSTKHMNGTVASPAEQPLAVMTLSNDPVVDTTDLINVTKILSEGDHHLSSNAPVITTPQQQLNDGGKGQSNQSHLSSVPIDENENFLLDMVYKCLRGKGVRMINSNYSSSSSNSNHSTNRSSSNDSNRSREKENSIDNHFSDDDMAATVNVTVNASTSLLLPPSQRYSSSARSSCVPKPIETNRFNMARGHGACHIKHSVDSTKKIQQQIFHRLQTQQHNGTTFANAGMIALRNNGSIMRLNSANLIGSSLSSITNAINNSANGPSSIKTNSTNASPVSTITTATNTQTGKIATKKSVHFVNSNGGSGPTGIVLLNSSGSGTTTTTTGNQTYAIFRRPSNQSIQLIAARPSSIDPNNSYSLMPVIHRVRTRTLKPTLPQALQSDQLLQHLKTIRPKKLKRTLSTTKKIISVYNSYVTPSIPNLHATQYNATAINTNSSASNGSKPNRSQKSHTTLSNHKSSSNHTPPTSTTTSSSSSSSTVSSQKQNGHIRSYAC